MRMEFVVLLCVCICCIIPTAQCMAKWMTKEECGKVLRVGEVIMGSEAKFSDKRVIKLYRNKGDIMLSNGEPYIPGEELLVMLYGPKDNVLQYVFEATNAEFIGGGCDGRRIANVNLGKLVIPENATGEVTVVAGWALGYSNVKITPTFTLVGGKKSPEKKVTETEGGVLTDSSKPVESADVQAEEGKNDASEPTEHLPMKLNLRGSSAGVVSETVNSPAANAASDGVTEETLKASEHVSEEKFTSLNDGKVEVAKSAPDAVPLSPAEQENSADLPTPVAPSADSARGKIHIEDIDKLDSVAEVDSAITTMQAMIKEMKRKRAEKLKATGGVAGIATGTGSEKAKSPSLKEVLQGNGAKKKGFSVGEGLSKEAVKSLLSIERAGQDSTKNGREAEANGDGVDDPALWEDGEQRNPLSASDGRVHRGTKGKNKNDKPIQLRVGPTGRLQDPIVFHEPVPWQSSAYILFGMLAMGLTGLIIISLAVVGSFYMYENRASLFSSVNRILRRKQGQDKE